MVIRQEGFMNVSEIISGTGYRYAINQMYRSVISGFGV